MFYGGGGSWYRAKELRYQRGWWIYWKSCVVNWDSPPTYDDYLEYYSQGGKIEFDENKVIYIQGEPITYTVDETFNIKKQKSYWFY